MKNEILTLKTSKIRIFIKKKNCLSFMFIEHFFNFGKFLSGIWFIFTIDF